MSWADQIADYRATKLQCDPQLCIACDGTGLDEGSGDAWWNQSKCPACGGDGFEPEPSPMTADELRAEELAQFDKWDKNERRTA